MGEARRVWCAASNGAVPVESVSKELSSYAKSRSGPLSKDYEACCGILQVDAHPALQLSDEEQECLVRNYVLDCGTLTALGCALDLNRSLRRILLHNVSLGTEGTRRVFGLAGKVSALDVLGLDYSTGPEAVQYLAGCTALSISLRGNRLGRAGRELARAIETNLKTKSINLFGNEIDDEAGVVAALRRNVALVHLSLAGNRLTDAVAAIETLTGYTLSSGDNDNIIEAHQEAMARVAAHNKKNKNDLLPTLEALIDVKDDKWGRGNSRLQTLNLSSNNIKSLQPCLDLLEGRRKRKTKDTPDWWCELSPALQCLDLTRNPCCCCGPGPPKGASSSSSEEEMNNLEASLASFLPAGAQGDGAATLGVGTSNSEDGLPPSSGPPPPGPAAIIKLRGA